MSLDSSAASVRDTVLLLAARELALPPERVEAIADNDDLAMHLDSLQRLSLVVAIEDHFQICFEEEDDTQVRTLAEVVAFIEQRWTRPPPA